MATRKPVSNRPHSTERAQAESLNGPSLAERVQAERQQLFKVIGIVELCRLATATSLEITDPEYMVPAFETICDQLNTAAERLEWLAMDLQKLPGSAKQ
ncbi:MAG: hypothetical protein QM808_02650 [Steroidobacteraceae bacterium]